jgi:hypothetical protein
MPLEHRLAMEGLMELAQLVTAMSNSRHPSQDVS